MPSNQQTIPLSKAIEYARQSPDSDFATQLRAKIESGELDDAARMQGVDLSRFGRPRQQSQSLETIFGIAGEQIPSPTMPTTAGTTDMTTNQAGVADTIAGGVVNTLGLGDASDVFGSVLARQGIGTDTPAEVVRENVEAPSKGEVAGALLKTAAVPAGVAISGGSSLLGQVAAGAGLGYAYDVGTDLIEGNTLAETATPGVGTIVGAGAPLALRGASKLFNMAYGGATPAVTETVSQVLPESSVVNAVSDTPISGAAQQTVEDVAMRGTRAVNRGKEFIQSQAERSARLASAPEPVKAAIRANLDDVVTDLATNADEPTKEILREMVKIAETPKTGRATPLPTAKAGEVAVEQFEAVQKARQAIGKEIGELSDRLSTAQQIPTLPAQNTMRDILGKNGIVADEKGVIKFLNKEITPEQQSVIQKLYTLATEDDVLSAKQIHQMDRLFSRLQRQSRIIDKVDDVYLSVPTADGKTTNANIFKVFRDVYSKQLDEIAPEFRALNKQYAKLSNFVEDVESGLIKTPEMSDLIQSQSFAEQGLRRMFGEGVGAQKNAAVYEALDTLSRELGYTGARADELYYFANKLRDIYPETIPETGLRKNISTSIKDVLGDVMDIGNPTAVDQQKALKALLEITNDSPKVKGATPQTTALLEEAKKYKSAEEFVKASIFSPARDSVARNTLRTEISKITEIRKADTLTPNPNNPSLDKSTINIKAEDITEGKRPYVLVDGNMIIDGHHAFEAYKKVGIDNLPVVERASLEEIWQQAKEK